MGPRFDEDELKALPIVEISPVVGGSAISDTH